MVPGEEHKHRRGNYRAGRTTPTGSCGETGGLIDLMTATVSEKGFRSLKSQTIGSASRENTPSCLSPDVCHLHREQPALLALERASDSGSRSVWAEAVKRRSSTNGAFCRVTADVKMSQIAEVELTHHRIVASSADTVRRCFRQIDEGGRSERNIRDERSGSFHPRVMVRQRPCLHQLEERRRAPGHERHHLPETGPLHLAGLAGAALGVERAVEAGDHLEIGLVLAGGIALGARRSRRGDVL